MAILSRVKISPQQRYDLEDLFADQAANRTDSKLWVKSSLSELNLVYGGFSVSGIGLNAATIAMTGAALIIPQNSVDFSYFVSAPSEPDVIISDADLVDGVRNYIEASLVTSDNTPLTKAFWDPQANSGAGAEFNQIVNTITDLAVSFSVSTGGFSGSPDKLPIAIIDTNGSGVIKLILDRRNMYGRLGKPNDIDNEYAWGTKVEPVYSLVMTANAGTFVAGETITIGGETAEVATGGTSSITFKNPSGISFSNGSSVLGGTSGATGTVNTILESFSGVDKSLNNQKKINDALMTEFKKLKGTRFWYDDAVAPISDVSRDEQEDRSAYLRSDDEVLWDGTQLNFTSDIILEILNTESGVTSIHSILLAGSPILINNGESIWVSINRASTSESLTVHRSSITPIPAQSASTKDVFVLFKRIDTGGVKYLHLPFSKQMVTEGQSFRLGQAGSGGSGVVKATLYDAISSVLPTGPTVMVDGIAGVNGDLVLFSNLGSNNNEIYKLGGVGTSITWTATHAFSGNLTPTDGDLIVIQNGTAFGNQVGQFVNSAFKFNDTVRYFSGTDFWELSSIKTSTLTDNTTGNVFTVTAAGSENIVANFSILRNGIKETATLWITSDGINASIATSGAYLGLTGVSFSADINAGNLRLRYTTSSTGFGATMKYFTQRWSDTPGGPSSITSYTPFVSTVNNSAFVMSDGSGTPLNCSSPTLVTGKTQVVLNFAYLVGANAGSTVGDMSIYVNGQRFPRFVAGVTLDGYYTEINSTTIRFNSDLSGSPLSLEFVKRV